MIHVIFVFKYSCHQPILYNFGGFINVIVCNICFSEGLIRVAFQSLQLVVTDFLPLMPCTCIKVVVDVAGKFGLQPQELNISLTAIGLLVSHVFFNAKLDICLGSDTFFASKWFITSDVNAYFPLAKKTLKAQLIRHFHGFCVVQNYLAVEHLRLFVATPGRDSHSAGRS